MFKKPNCPVIAIEEHYWDAELVQDLHRRGIRHGPGPQQERLFDLGALRLKEMDETGIDIQVISHGAPSAQKLSGDGAVALVQRVNDRLAAACAANPKRFLGFAALPTCDPKAAADELERCVTKHGFKGAMMHGLANGVFLDGKQFWPIYERAEKLDVPIYFHPGLPDARVMEAYYNDYAKDFPMVVRAAWGYTVETATTAIRMVLSGVFEKHPKLKVIIGHLGETLAVPGLARRPRDLAAGRGEADQLPRHLVQQLLDHDQRQLLQPGADVLRAGDGRRPHSVLGRLAVRRQPAGRRLDEDGAAVRRGQGEDPERQREAIAAYIKRSPASSSAARDAISSGVAHSRFGPVAQWLEPTAHNGLVGGSSPPGPTTHSLANRRFPEPLLKGPRMAALVVGLGLCVCGRWMSGG